MAALRFAAGVALLALALAAPRSALAAWCAELNDGSRTCGIPSEEACRMTVSGVGGICTLDQGGTTYRRNPGLFQRLFNPGARQDLYRGNNLPYSNDVPPPPLH